MSAGPLDLNVEVTGNPDGPAAVFFHGLMSSNVQWELHRDRLGQHLHLHLVELPGHGSSSAPDRAEAYGPDVVLQAVHEIRRRAGIDRWWVIGQSLGGAVAMRLVLADPASVLGLIVTNSRAALGKTRTADLKMPATQEEQRTFPFHPIHAKRFPEEIKRRMVESADKMPLHVLEHVRDNAPLWSCRDELDQLSVPVLLVNGRWEKAFQPSVALAREQIRDLTVVELDGGHSINVERPSEFEDAVLEFIAGDPSRGR